MGVIRKSERGEVRITQYNNVQRKAIKSSGKAWVKAFNSTRQEQKKRG